MKGRKWWMCVLGLGVTLATALTHTMDGNVALCVSVCCGGFAGADAAITRAAIHNRNGGYRE